VKGPAGGSLATVDHTTGLIHAYFTPAIKFQTVSHPTGYYLLKVTVSAAVAPARTVTFTSNVFKLGSPVSLSATRKVTAKGSAHGKHHKPRKKRRH
jgi:hypothetical protein